MTIDSVKDHLNSTVSTICSQTTEEIVGMFHIFIWLFIEKKNSYKKLQFLVELFQNVQNLLDSQIDKKIVNL